MCDYRIRNGVVLEEICGRYLLISTEAVREKCYYVRMIDDITAYYWEMMEQGLTVSEMVGNAHMLFSDISEPQLRSDLEELIDLLKSLGYLLSDEELKELTVSDINEK